jgi:hypothetical protein
VETDEFDDQIREFGLITAIEDIGYPRYIITVEFPERQLKRDFNFNVEADHLDVEGLNELNGKYATLYYASEFEPNLYHLHIKGKTLFGEYAPEYLEGTEKIIGVLSNTDEPTPGDLLGVVKVLAKSGEAISFEYFVTEEIVEGNKQLVTAYCMMRGVETITRLEASESN